MEITRRTILAAGAATAAAAIFPRPHVARAALPLSQPALPFAEADLAPVISAKTVGLHYGKHHKAYYDKLNTLAAGTRYADMELDRIVVESARSKEAADVKIFNNAAQAWNHVAYWDQFVPGGPNRPQGDLAASIDKAFGGYDGFVKRAVDVSDTVFGTGWVWLTRDDSGLALIGYEDGNNPVAVGRPAYLGIDIWEHAYYVDYENRKAEHIRAVLDKLVNWRVVEERMKA
ncbi:superoxide dismutase [Agrobacterium sp. CMT1]|jgi:superoxide dismutase, Fe-Mn family|uniref:superoxide dismutase n=1 Tax=Agrobacterium TaxID=357 RepID=UPI0007D7FF31|nr:MULTISPECIES: superoxide dismutase [Agrobacterium]MBB2906483.1 Fe-Mn family superoxide dismutase [Rhizobium sp. RAS22]OAI82338.1 superoxide dismutase [Rhizobium sp. GHKF11]MBN8932532.1 superoxide dismutase [Agrobacterium pusense]MBW9080426.1 superoxide dismutase [Agrobacterium pusense]MCW8280776.1 superoxide dismutase [Agrobacterium sp. InxBP2]